MKVLFWGTPEFAVPALREIDEEGHQIVGVVTQPDRPAGRGRATRPSPVKQVAVAEGFPVLQPERARGPDFESAIRELAPDVSVVVAFGQILKPEILAVPRLGSINIHASLLPELRGAAPIAWAIANGHETTGISIMRMEAGLDSGPVILAAPVRIREDESAGELAQRLAIVGADAVVAALARLETGTATETPQDHTKATCAPKLDRDAARVDWTVPAADIARRIRAFDPAPGAWTGTPAGAPVKLFGAAPAAGEGEPGVVLDVDGERGLLVAAGRGAVAVREVQPAGKRRMSAAEWLRGRGLGVGERFA